MDNLIIPLVNKMLPKQSQSEDDPRYYVGAWIKVETSRATKRYHTAIVPEQTSVVAQNNVHLLSNSQSSSALG